MKRNKLVSRFLILFLFLLGGAACKKDSNVRPDGPNGSVVYQGMPMAPGIVLGYIYHSPLFNAFTDLVYYKGKWIVVFREGTKHAGGTPGVIKVLTSEDGGAWKLDNTLSRDSIDLRDPKLTIDSLSDELYITCFGRNVLKGPNEHFRNFSIKYSSQMTSEDIEEIHNEWPDNNRFILWRWTIDGMSSYSLGYRLTSFSDTTVNLVLTQGDRRLRNLRSLKNINLRGQPSECTLRFDARKQMYLVVRSEYTGFYLGAAQPPYTNIEWEPNDRFTRLASPNFLFYKSYLLITGRDLIDYRFKFFAYNLEKKKIEKEIVFKGGIEVGYSGMSYNPADRNEVWITYYSYDTNGCDIYLAKMKLNEVLK